jgi:ribosomal protein S18 acetylase RimI-like enzyme
LAITFIQLFINLEELKSSSFCFQDNMEKFLTDLSEKALANANKANLRASSPFPYNLPGSEVYDGEDVSYCFTDIPFTPCNVVFNARLEPDKVDGTIVSIIGKARTRGVPIRWYICDDSEPKDLGKTLLDHGFTSFDRATPLMATDLYKLKGETTVPSRLEIIEVKGITDLKTWSQVATEGFGGTPENEKVNFRWFTTIRERGLPMHFYLAFLDGRPAATSQLVPAEGVAGIFYVATLPEFRNRGIGYAATLHACEAGREIGYRIATLQASPMGEPVYRRMGFIKCGEVWAYQWRESHS